MKVNAEHTGSYNYCRVQEKFVTSLTRLTRLQELHPSEPE